MPDTGTNMGSWTTYGAYLANQKLSAEMRAQALGMYVYRQFVDKKDGLGKSAGDVVTFSKRLRIDTAGSSLTETASIVQHNIKVLKGTASVVEYGNKVLYSLKADTLSKFNMRSEYGQGLTDDQVFTLDNVIFTVFQTAKFKAVCTNTGKSHINFTTTGTATATATGANITSANMRGIIDYAKKAQIPKMGSMYICVGSTALISSVYDDLMSVAQYAEPEFRFKDEIGKYYGARFIEDNSQASNVKGSQTLMGEGFLFGDEAVAEAVAMPEEVRYYEEEAGRFRYLMWLAILGYAKIWDRVADGTTAYLNGLERIIHITSA